MSCLACDCRASTVKSHNVTVLYDQHMFSARPSVPMGYDGALEREVETSRIGRASCPRSERPSTSMNLFVGNLPFRTGGADLEALFSQHGAVDSAAVINDRETGRSRGFGFVEMPNDEEGRAAIEALDGFDYEGRKLTVNEARPRR